MKPNKQVNNLIVKCPGCGCEYHLSEIAMPGELLGTPANNGIVKDPEGRILLSACEWEEEPIQVFEYCCDECDKKFLVEAKIVLTVRNAPEEEDFSNLSSSLL